MLNTKEIQSSNHFLNQNNKDFVGGYKNIPIFAAPDLHEKCFDVLNNLFLDKNISILILGAGAGAFDQRLIDCGYKNITAIEFIKENYKADNKNIFDYDLNEDFHLKLEDKKFDMVVAIEIIEHLYSPYDFLRKIKYLLNENGYILLSTPNPENGISRIKFLLAKQIQLFGPLDLIGSGHIAPIFENVLNYYLKSLNFKLSSKSSNRNIFKALSFKLKIAYIVFFPFIFYKRDEGQIHIFLIQK